MAQKNEVFAQKTEKKSTFSRFLSNLTNGTSSNVEELEGRLLSLVRDLPLCGQSPWKLREIERLLSKGAPISSRSCFEHYTTLHSACLNKDLVTAELLIRHGANVNAMALDESTPLHIVANKQSPTNPSLIKLLHENGADLNATNSYRETPLHLAAMLEDPSNAKMLISLGANLYPSSKANITIECLPANRPLVYSVRSGRTALILLFLKCGDSFEDFSAQSLLSYGYLRCIHFEIIKIFVEAGLKVPRDLFVNENNIATFSNWPEDLKEWLTNPLPLQMLCMRTIRESVGKNRLERASELSLPSRLKQRLMYDVKIFELDKCKAKWCFQCGRNA